MRRLTGHSRPDLLSVSPSARAQRIRTRDEHHRNQNRLKHGNQYESANEWRVPVVDGADSRLDDWSVLAVELCDVTAKLRRPNGGRERYVCRVRRTPLLVGENHGNARLPDVSRKLQQGGGRSVRIWITQAVVHARIHEPNPRRF